MKLELSAEQQRQVEALATAGDRHHGTCVLIGQVRRIPFPEPGAGTWALYLIAAPCSASDGIRAVIKKAGQSRNGKGKQ